MHSKVSNEIRIAFLNLFIFLNRELENSNEKLHLRNRVSKFNIHKITCSTFPSFLNSDDTFDALDMLPLKATFYYLREV